MDEQEKQYVEDLKEPEWETLSGSLDLQKLLRWGLANATKGEDTTKETVDKKEIDPKWLDVIMGKSDAIRMKECMERVLKKEDNEDDKWTALDELELLVEDIDNAKDFVRLNMLVPLAGYIAQESNVKLRVQAVWILGTMVQNNPFVKRVFLEKNIIGFILKLLSDAIACDAVELASKCVYVLSGLLKHNKPGQSDFTRQEGHAILLKLLHQLQITHEDQKKSSLAEKILFMYWNLTIDSQQQSELPFASPDFLSIVKSLKQSEIQGNLLKELKKRGLE